MTSRVLQENSDLLLTQSSDPLINDNFIGANGFSTASPQIASTAIAQIHALTSVSIVTQDPVVSSTAIAQEHSLSALGFVTGSPVANQSTLTQEHDLTALGFITGNPVANQAALTQDHGLTASGLITGSPVVSDATMTEDESFSIPSVVTGTPEVNSTAISQNYSLVTDGILTGRPDVEDATDPNTLFEQVEQKMLGGWPRRLFEHTDLAIARGFTKGHKALYKFGYNPDVNGEEETVWAQGGNMTYPTSAVTMFVSSTSANDANGGTGANSILIQGLDENYDEIEETVFLNGQTQVATQLAYLRVYRAFVTLAGTGGTSGGTIYVGSSGATGGVPNTTVYANLSFGNQTQIAAYTVPAGYTLYVDDINFTAALSQANKTATCSFVSRTFGSNVFRTRLINVLQSNQLIAKFEYPQPFTEKTDLECRVITNTTNNAIGASFQGVLIKNTA
jgi:hypothetical protein